MHKKNLDRGNMNKYIIFAFISVLLISVGQILLKYSTKTLDLSTENLNYNEIKKIISNQYLILAIFIYMVSAVLWTYTLAKMDLSFAYLLLSISSPIVIILSGIFLQEMITSYKIVGTILILIANIIIFTGAKYDM